VFKCENIYQEMVLEDDLHRTGFLSDKKGMRLREIVERKCPQEPGIHSFQDDAGPDCRGAEVSAGVEAEEGEVNSR
jgi:hypothetical protein